MDILTILLLIIISSVSTWISIVLSKRESKQYTLNNRETALVYGLSMLFTSWVIYSRWGSTNLYALILFTICFSVLSVSFYIDIKLQELPDIVTILVLVCVFALLMQPTILEQGLVNFLYRFLLAAGFTFLCFIFSVKTENLGMGDVKLLFPMLLLIGIDQNALTGGYKIIYYLYNVLSPAFVVSLITLMVYKKRDKMIAFGPFMILGFVLTFSLMPTSILGF